MGEYSNIRDWTKFMKRTITIFFTVCITIWYFLAKHIAKIRALFENCNFQAFFKKIRVKIGIWGSK
jgi:hypothetical protein